MNKLTLSLEIAWHLWAIFWTLLRSCLHLVHGRLAKHSRAPRAKQPDVDCPVVLVPGNMGHSANCALELRRCLAGPIISPPLGPVSSCHDRACELFYALKGGRVDFGAQHAAACGHTRWSRGRACGAMLPVWDERHPVILLCHSQGTNCALCLCQLLEAGAFAGHRTSARWVRAVVCIASPLAGVPLLTSRLGGVPPASPSRSRRAAPSAPPTPPISWEQPGERHGDPILVHSRPFPPFRGVGR